MMRIAVLMVAVFAGPVFADTAHYSKDEPAPIDTYLAESEQTEIALALSAAPPRISTDAAVMIFRPSGYEQVRAGENGFVCLVERSWAGDTRWAGAFWDPKIRAPICYNAHAAESVLPVYLYRTELVLAGKSRGEIAAALDAAVSAGRFKAPTGTAMSYMMSGGQYLHPDIGRWLPHLMIWMPYTAQADWGPNPLAGPDPVVFRNPGGPFAMVVIPYEDTRFIDP